METDLKKLEQVKDRALLNFFVHERDVRCLERAVRRFEEKLEAAKRLGEQLGCELSEATTAYLTAKLRPDCTEGVK
jgi:hypothetical protein